MPQISLPVDDFSKPPSSTANLINCFIEQQPQDAKSPSLLSRTPGIKAWATVGNGPIRAMIEALDALFVVSGTKLYRVDEFGSATELGDIGAASSIDIDANTDSVVVVNEPAAFYWDGTTFGQIVDPDFTSRGAGDVEFVNNYLLFREPNSGRFFGADLGSATSFDALQFATAESNPDELVGMKVDHTQAILLGKKSVEVWDNNGSSGFPFARAINGFVEIGCFNGRTVSKCDNSIFWLANDYTVRRLDGVTPIRVSNHGIEKAIKDATISTAQSFSYSQEGHLFYVLSFNEVTVVYDATTKTWHKRQTYGIDNWAVSSHANAFGLELVGSTQTGAIGSLDRETRADWGNTQRVSWTYQPIYSEGRRVFHDRIEVVMKTGVGVTSGQGSNPQLMMDYSDDSGITWASLPNKSMGRLGSYQTTVDWRALGSTEHARVYRGTISDPVDVQLVDTQVSVRGGRI